MINILLVDDDEVIRKALTEVLRLQYFKVTTLADGTAVLKEITRRKYDIIVMDIVMPDKEGLETIEAVRKINRDIPIIAVSGGGKTQPDINLNIAKMLGATDILAKPFDSAALIYKIHHILKH